jgi:hypothetical protein
MRVSAFAGLPAKALTVIFESLGDPVGFPSTITGWLDWLVNFLRDDEASRESLFDGDSSLIKTVARGKRLAVISQRPNLRSSVLALDFGAPHSRILSEP